MNLARETWALIVGIDEYDDPALARLTGAVADAIAAVGWLRQIGVPDGQILLHAAPSATSQVALDALGLSWNVAREPEIWKSIASLRTQVGQRLFVFLSGHGLYEPAEGRMFLTQEAGVGGAWVNMGMDEYLKLFLSMQFPRQFLFMDGCQNYPYGPNVRPTVTPAMHTGVSGYLPQPQNAMVACFAAGQGERAVEIGGRGAFLRRLFEAIDISSLGQLPPNSPLWSSIELDWASGCLHVDLSKLMVDWLRPTVESDALHEVPPIVQRPQILPLGAAQSGPPFLMCRLPNGPVAGLELNITPPQAIPDVEALRTWSEDPPGWSTRIPKPPANQVAVPVAHQLPQGRRVVVECSVRPQAQWDIVQARESFQLTADRQVNFHLTPHPGGPPPGGQGPSPAGGWPVGPGPRAPGSPAQIGPSIPAGLPGVGGQPRPDGDDEIETLSVKLQKSDGSPAYEMGFQHELYAEVERHLGLNEPMDTLFARLDIQMHRHEDGPVFRVPRRNVVDAQAVLAAWERSIKQRVSPDVSVIATTQGIAPTAVPRVRVVLPKGGASQLAGPLSHQVAVRFTNDVSRMWYENLGRLERDPYVEVPPGPLELRLSLPWGEWSRRVIVPAAGDIDVELPARIGSPPLRVVIPRSAWPADPAILGLNGDPRTMRVELLSRQKVPRPRVSAATAPVAWRVSLPKQVSPLSASVIDSTGVRVNFPLYPGRVMAMSGGANDARVEPLSSLPLTAWDVLVTQGQLGGLSDGQASDLTYGKWEDPIVGLAGAYALLDRKESNLDVVLRNLTRLEVDAVDLSLLRAVSESRRGSVTDATRAMIRKHAPDAIPVMRWGVHLALSLDRDMGLLRDYPGWRERLISVHARLSAVSTWTVWTT